MKLLDYQVDFLLRHYATKPLMNLAPTNPKEVLLEVCDDLLAACGHLRAIREKAGEPWPNSEAKRLINAVLDCRNQISPPKTTKPKLK